MLFGLFYFPLKLFLRFRKFKKNRKFGIFNNKNRKFKFFENKNNSKTSDCIALLIDLHI